MPSLAACQKDKWRCICPENTRGHRAGACLFAAISNMVAHGSQQRNQRRRCPKVYEVGNTYVITPTIDGATLANYTVNAVTANLTITARPITITANAGQTKAGMQ